MAQKTIFGQLPDVLLPWYAACKRDLPWRQDRDPYHIWISEIMLQQTRVEAVKGYYSRFLNAIPDVRALSNADDELLHKLWEGLGYYSRVRNLKKAARVITDQYGGVFPGEYKDIIALPGIGEYTAGAICSIAYDQRVPAVDGNVLRVAARLLDDSTPIDAPFFKKEIRTALEQIYPKDAGAFTQALMELGATLCGPNRKPECEKCPCRGFCLSHRNGTAEMLPVKLPKRGRRSEDLTVFILRCEDRYALQKRPDSGLLAGLWQFPNLPGKMELPMALEAVEQMALHPAEIIKQVDRQHIFTHVQWDMRGFYIKVKNTNQGFAWMTADEINTSAALPTAFRQFWETGEMENG